MAGLRRSPIALHKIFMEVMMERRRFKVARNNVKVNVRLPAGLVKEMDSAIQRGLFVSRSGCIRELVIAGLAPESLEMREAEK